MIPGKQPPNGRTTFSAAFNIISPGYFRTMTIPIRTGREFSRADSWNAPGVIVVNEAAVRRFWSGEQAIGKQIGLLGPDKSVFTLTVVGVAGDVRQQGLGIAPGPEIFLSYLQPLLPGRG